MKIIERTLLDLAVLALALLGGVIFINVVMRSAFGTGLPDAIIMVRELMVAAVILPMAAATAERSHVAVTFISDRMPERVRVWLIILGHAIGVLSLLPLLYAAQRMLGQTWVSGEFYYGDLNLPRWPGLALFCAGLFLMWIRLAMLLVGDLRQVMATGRIVDADGQGVN